MLIDFHMHTSYTIDAHGTVEEFCRAAAENGFSHICITNHQEWCSVLDKSNHYALTDENWKKFYADISAARKRFPRLFIGFGVELGYYEDYEQDILDFSRKYPFDYVIGSVHQIFGRSITDPNYAAAEDQQDKVKVVAEYIRLLKKAISLGYMDMIGHLDVFRKSMPEMDLGMFEKDLSEIAGLMKLKDIGFELNTMGWRYKNKECYPSVQTLAMLGRLGVSKVTLGSDSHVPQDQGFMIGRGAEELRKAGFGRVCTFDRRKVAWHTI